MVRAQEVSTSRWRGDQHAVGFEPQLDACLESALRVSARTPTRRHLRSSGRSPLPSWLDAPAPLASTCHVVSPGRLPLSSATIIMRFSSTQPHGPSARIKTLFQYNVMLEQSGRSGCCEYDGFVR